MICFTLAQRLIIRHPGKRRAPNKPSLTFNFRWKENLKTIIVYIILLAAEVYSTKVLVEKGNSLITS